MIKHVNKFIYLGLNINKDLIDLNIEPLAQLLFYVITIILDFTGINELTKVLRTH